jgi:hypothetical protein
VAEVKEVQGGASHARGGVFGADNKDDAINVGSQAGDVIGGHDRRAVENDKVIGCGGFLEEAHCQRAEEQFARPMSRGAAGQQEEVGDLGRLHGGGPVGGTAIGDSRELLLPGGRFPSERFGESWHACGKAESIMQTALAQVSIDQ